MLAEEGKVKLVGRVAVSQLSLGNHSLLFQFPGHIFGCAGLLGHRFVVHCQYTHNDVKSHSVDVVDSYNDLYAFHYSPQEKKFSRENGWSIFNQEKEFG